MSVASARPVNSSNKTILSIENLRTVFETSRGGKKTLAAVDGVSLSMERGETLGLVGESGCGKSVTALSILRLVPPPGRIESGTIRFDGQNLLDLPEREMRRVRGARAAMIFQEPMTSLNPVYTVGEQIAEVFRLHKGMNRAEAWEASVAMIRRVRLADPERRAKDYPHHLSGGQRQRIMIAMALAAQPKLLLADEPTTALDVTIQAQILDLLRELKEQFGMSLLLITHDLGVVAEMADRVVVMYAGAVMESAPVKELFQDPRHPYTRGLIASVPRLGEKRKRLADIPGSVPPLWDMPAGCRFSDRCDQKHAHCAQGEPLLEEVTPGHFVRCCRAREGGGRV